MYKVSVAVPVDVANTGGVEMLNFDVFLSVLLPGFQLFPGYGMVGSWTKGWGGMVLTAQG